MYGTVMLCQSELSPASFALSANDAEYFDYGPHHRMSTSVLAVAKPLSEGCALSSALLVSAVFRASA